MSILNKSSILVIRTIRQNVCQHVRYLSLSRTVLNSKKGENSVTQTTENQQLQTSFSQKSKRLLSVKCFEIDEFITAKENVKTASYSMVVIAGLGATLVVLYVIFQELFSGETAQSFFQYGSKQCMEHEKVQDLLGEPIKAYGEETRRHKSKRVAHMEYQTPAGERGIRLQFTLVGLRRKAIVDMDAREVCHSIKFL